MTAALLLDNLLAWSLQVSALAAAAFFVGFAITQPRARLLFWQGILAAALLLPAVQPWRQPAAQTGGVTAGTSTTAVVVARGDSSGFHWKREYILGVLAAGAALRLLWIAAGLSRLRRHRLEAQMLTAPPVPFSNPRVRWYVSSTVGGPVTFGARNPSILLPARVFDLAPELREAIAHHELEHVRRADWLFVLGEEAIRALLWFHPAIWFVLSRIQLAREQVVDAEVVGLTHDREQYLHALVAVAAQRLLPDVAPAPLFLKKRQLAQRVAAVLKETRMSKPRMILTFTAAGSATFLAAFAAVWMFPMQAPAQTAAGKASNAAVADGPGVTVDLGAKILHRTPVFYPGGVTATGDVVVETSVDTKGEVTDARIISGPQELRSAVLKSVLGWHFSTDGGLAPTVQSTIHFASAPKPPQVTAQGGSASLILKYLDTSSLSPDLAQKVQAAIPLQPGSPLGNAELQQVKAAVKEIDTHLAVAIRTFQGEATLSIMLPGTSANIVSGVAGGAPSRIIPDGVSGGVSGGITGGVSRGVSGGVSSGAPGALIADGAATTPGAIRVGGNVQANNLIKKVTPLYPPEAKAARIQGLVRFTATIGKDGTITNLEVVSGHPLLVESAQSAVSQWVYKPTLLNGQPVEVITQIDVNFTLSE